MQPKLCYFILTTPRSGSHLFSEALTNTHLAGRPSEYFHRYKREPVHAARFVSALESLFEATTTPNGVFGVTIFSFFFEPFLGGLSSIAGKPQQSIPELLSLFFPNLHYIWLRRRDKVRQAVSHWKASQNGIWMEPPSIAETEPTGKKPVFDFEAIERTRRWLQKQEEEMQDYFAHNALHPLTILYEDFASTYEQTALHVLDFLGIAHAEPLVFGERILRKQADAHSETWVQLYYQRKYQQQDWYSSVER